MKTFLDCTSKTREYLDEAVEADWLDSQVQRAVNQKYQMVITNVMTVFEDFYLTKVQLNSVAGQQEYGSADGLPSNIFKWRRVEVNWNPTQSQSIPQRALPVRLDEVRRDLANAGISLPVGQSGSYYRYGFGSSAKIGLIPVPTQNGTNAITVWHIPQIADLSSTTDQLNIPYPDRYWEIIPLMAAGDLLRKGQQEEGAAKTYLGDGASLLEIMKQELEDTVADDQLRVVDTEAEMLDFGAYV